MLNELASMIASKLSDGDEIDWVKSQILAS
jgi:hypothetical protein